MHKIAATFLSTVAGLRLAHARCVDVPSCALRPGLTVLRGRCMNTAVCDLCCTPAIFGLYLLKATCEVCL